MEGSLLQAVFKGPVAPGLCCHGDVVCPVQVALEDLPDHPALASRLETLQDVGRTSEHKKVTYVLILYAHILNCFYT